MVRRLLLAVVALGLLGQAGMIFRRPIILPAAPTGNNFAILTWVNDSLVSGTTTYFPVFGAEGKGLNTNEDLSEQVIPAAGTITKMHCGAQKDVGAAGASIVYTLRHAAVDANLSDTSVTCTVTGSGGSTDDCVANPDQCECSYSATTIPVVAQDRVSIKITPAGTLGAGDIAPRCYLQITSDAANKSFLMGHNSITTSSVRNMAPMGGSGLLAPGGSSIDTEIPIPEAITITDFCVDAEHNNGNPISTGNYVLDLESCTGINTCNTVVASLTIDSTDSSKCVTVSNTVNAQETMRLHSVGSGGPENVELAWGIAYTHTSGHFMVPICFPSSGTADRYSELSAGFGVENSLETRAYMNFAPSMTLRALGFQISPALVATATFAMHVRDFDTSTNINNVQLDEGETEDYVTGLNNSTAGANLILFGDRENLSANDGMCFSANFTIN